MFFMFLFFFSFLHSCILILNVVCLFLQILGLTSPKELLFIVFISIFFFFVTSFALFNLDLKFKTFFLNLKKKIVRVFFMFLFIGCKIHPYYKNLQFS